MNPGSVAGQSGRGYASGDRIDVTDAAGVRIGWVDPRTGVRNLLAPGRRAEFDQMIDYWMSVAGLNQSKSLAQGPEGSGEPKKSPTPETKGTPARTASPFSPVQPTSPLEVDALMQVTEVRYPDAQVVRSLLIPLVALA